MPGRSLSVVYRERTKSVCADSASGCLVVLHFFFTARTSGRWGRN